MTIAKYLEQWQPSAAQRAFRDGVARAFGVDPLALVGRSRVARTVRARHAAYWLLRRRFPEMSWPQIGAAMGGRDHSTVIYGATRCDDTRARDPDYRRKVDALLHGEPADRWKPVNPAIVARLVRKPAGAEPADECVEVRPGAWCDQCDALVAAERVDACRDRWCSLKATASGSRQAAGRKEPA